MIFLRNLISKKSFTVFALAALALTSCVAEKKSASNTPTWYISPKQNNAETLYGVAAGYSLEDSTKSALADAASRLMVSISSESSLIREENKVSTNEETRQQIKQNIEKIDFTNFKVSRSEKLASQFFVEVEIKRAPFVSEQKEKVTFLERQISDLAISLDGANPIQKRATLTKLIDLCKQVELSSRILNGAGANIDLKEKLSRLASFQNQFNKLNSNVEFYFEINSPKEIASVIRSALNKEKIKISKERSSGSNQIIIMIKSSSRSNNIYGSYLTKLHIDFSNLSSGKTIASNSIEITGNSSINQQESYAAAVNSLEEKIAKDGILTVIGITN